MSFKAKTLAEAQERYGEIVQGIWAKEAECMTVLPVNLPGILNTATGIINTATGKQLEHIYCNKDFVEPFVNWCGEMERRGVLQEIKTFDGCFYIRPVRGLPGRQSVHSYGMAIDFNAKENPLGGPVAFSDEFIQCARDVGFICGADFQRKDGMHFQYAERWLGD